MSDNQTPHQQLTVIGPNGEPSTRVESHRHEYADRSVKKLLNAHIKHRVVQTVQRRTAKIKKSGKFY